MVTVQVNLRRRPRGARRGSDPDSPGTRGGRRRDFLGILPPTTMPASVQFWRGGLNRSALAAHDQAILKQLVRAFAAIECLLAVANARARQLTRRGTGCARTFRTANAGFATSAAGGGVDRRLRRFARRQVEVEQRAPDLYVGQEHGRDHRPEQVHRGDRGRREQKHEQEKRSADLAEHPERPGDRRSVPPMPADQPGAAAQRLADRAILEQDLLLDELPVDELSDREGDPDDRHEQGDDHDRGDKLHGDQPPDPAADGAPGRSEPG